MNVESTGDGLPDAGGPVTDAAVPVVSGDPFGDATKKDGDDGGAEDPSASLREPSEQTADDYERTWDADVAGAMTGRPHLSPAWGFWNDDLRDAPSTRDRGIGD